MVLTKNTINTITAFLLLVTNAVMFYIDKSNSLDRYISLSIPIIAIVFIYILRNKNIYVFYSIVAVLITIFGSTDNYAGIIFFYISINDRRSKNNIILNISLLLISLCIKAYIVDYFMAHIFSLIIASFFVFFHLYIRFWPISKVRQYIGTGRGLTVEQLNAIDKMINGKSHKDASLELKISRTAYTMRLSGLRSRYHVGNDSQLTIALIKDGIISLNSLTYDNIEPQDFNNTKI